METNTIAGVVRDLEGWAGRFLAAAGAEDPTRAEEAVAGLVEWMGHDLVDAFLFLDIPTWEALSGLAEDLFQALREGQAGIPGAGGGGAGSAVTLARDAIGGILQRARVIRDVGVGRCP